MRLYDFPGSPHCLKVRAVAHELGIRLEVAEVNILRGESHSREFEKLNPNGLVPVLVDGDFVLWESNAIITYLASTHPSPMLLSAEARERADVDRWLHWQSAHLGPAVSKVVFERFVKPMTMQAPIDHLAAAQAASDFDVHCRALEASLDEKEYVAIRLSVADFAIACILNSAAMVGLGVEAFPRTKAWLERMLTRESLRRALAEAQLSLSEMYRVGR
jgi:glutathione S-transferase